MRQQEEEQGRERGLTQSGLRDGAVVALCEEWQSAEGDARAAETQAAEKAKDAGER